MYSGTDAQNHSPVYRIDRTRVDEEHTKRTSSVGLYLPPKRIFPERPVRAAIYTFH